MVDLTTVTLLYVCFWGEVSGSSVQLFPPGGVPVLRVSKHPLDVEPSEGEQGAQCLPTPSALSWMRLPSWFLAPNLTWHAWGWGKHQPHQCWLHREGPRTKIRTSLRGTSEQKKKIFCDVKQNSFFFSNPQNISASFNTGTFSFHFQSQVLIWQFLLLQANNNWVTNKAILVLIGQVSGVSIPVPLNVRRRSS